MPPIILYTSCIAGAVGLFLLANGKGGPVRGLGTLVALGALAWMMTSIFADVDGPIETSVLPLIFGVIAVMAAVRVTTHRRPVFAALYFVLVVIASSGLFLTLHAEFMAFALVIVYAGAILITYLFVLMLAQQSPTDGTDSGSSWYDRTPREPAIALLACFILLSSLVQVMTDTEAQDFARQTATKAEQSQQLAWKDLERMPRQLERVAREAEPETASVTGGITFDGDRAQVEVTLADGGTRTVTLPVESMPTNTQIIGLALVADFPVSLELAGVILLMAMFGAVVLARRQIELGEDEIRESAGMAPEVERGGDE